MKIKVTDVSTSNSPGGTSNFLRADGSWNPPPGSGTVTVVSFNNANGITGTITNPYTTPTITLSIDAGSIGNSRLANMAAATFKGRDSGSGTGAPQDLTPTQATALLNVFTSSLKGVVPASGGGTANFLRADGSWSPPTSAIYAPVVTGETPGPVLVAGTSGECIMVQIG